VERSEDTPYLTVNRYRNNQGECLLDTVTNEAIRRAIQLIADLYLVEQISNIEVNSETGIVNVTACIKLGLPFQWLAQGQSPNGVLAIEPVTFSFPPTYPVHAPTVMLRDDFNRSLAHVQPGVVNGSVFPCIYEGNIDELMHSEGLVAIVDQVITWLENAALNKLIDPQQGWEPVRRDSLKDIVIADTQYLRELVSRQEEHFFLLFEYTKITSTNTKKEFWVHGEIRTIRVKLSSEIGDLFSYWQPGKHVLFGKSLALVVTPGKLPSGQRIIADQYQPETVTNFSELSKRAKEYGCSAALQAGFEALTNCLKKLQTLRNEGIPLAVVLCVRRPYPLIGDSSNIEIIPYILNIHAPNLLVQEGLTPIFPAGHLHSITPQLLHTLSGEPSLPDNRDVALIGCGSLGSKIAIHLARSGKAPKSVIDKSYFSPHNAARHALIPDSSNNHLGCLDSKAKALSSAISGLGQVTTPFTEDITKTVNDTKLLRKLIPQKTWGIINATASILVREALASISTNYLKTRIIEAALFANGYVGTLTVEGAERNPNSADLIANFYELVRQDDYLRNLIFTQDSPMQRRPIGHGCSSTTMAISDARISLFAAAMAEGISEMRVDGLSDSAGKILLGELMDGGIGLKWQSITVPPVKIISIEGKSSWTVRLSEHAHQQILEECAHYPSVETGGILMGRVSESQHAFLVTNVLPSPSDSYRSASEFKLGISGVRIQIEEYVKSCNYTLYSLGTWHSHLGDSRPSPIDLQTATTLADGRVPLSVMLIRSSAEYRAILATKE
jgi:proteasome lid subunit RPN8/RPN11